MVLEKLGGCAYLSDICVLAKYYIGDSSQAKQVEANVRRELNTNHELFCHVDGMPKGWWQLKTRKDEIDKLKHQVAEQAEELDRYRSMIPDMVFLDNYIDVVLDMGENVINAHELALNRLNRLMNHRYEKQIVRLTDKSIERVEQKQGDIVLGNKKVINTTNYKSKIQTQNNDIPISLIGQQDEKLLEDE